jgi:hypothetical protein
MTISHHTVAVDGLDIFYREAGSRNNPLESLRGNWVVKMLGVLPVFWEALRQQSVSHVCRLTIPTVQDRMYQTMYVLKLCQIMIGLRL